MPKLVKDYRQLLDNKDIDVLIIGTPIIGIVYPLFKRAKRAKMFMWRNHC